MIQFLFIVPERFIVRRMNRFSTGASAALLLCALFLGGCAFPNNPPREISAIHRVELGGVEQAYRERGVSADLPLLLFLHGGPGVPEMPLAAINAELEKNFIVVHWDQRGAGKSFDPANPPKGMTVDQFTDDALELTDLLLEEHGREKLHLVGFSFGSLIGMKAVHRHPEKFITYTSIAQLVNIPASEVILKEEALKRANEAGDTRALRKLESYGETADDTHAEEAVINKISSNLVSHNVTNPFGMWDYLGTAFVSGIYSPYEIGKTIYGRRYSGEAMDTELYEVDLRKSVPSIKVPATFLLGRWDTLLSAKLAEDYIKNLGSPRGKSIVWFEESGHPMHLEQPDKFLEVMRGIARRHQASAD